MKRRDTEIPTGWSYVGCVTESNDQRLLAGFAYASETAMSPLTCLTVCQGFGYQLAGMEYGDEVSVVGFIKQVNSCADESTMIVLLRQRSYRKRRCR